MFISDGKNKSSRGESVNLLYLYSRTLLGRELLDPNPITLYRCNCAGFDNSAFQIGWDS